ncbi:tyrosine-type recombinase/integrase [Pediococcus pentosaceus]|uniref:Tyrosine-type recombinase/integrase n=1 Tax=Pediococcus pentosaceus TaxID=1255 RepID=A0ABD7X5S5_PEDPE|nr:site-specific integrase [Pediococcus pentosaceus]WEA56775.1 tyrosine-type recombinase/integrase [Pediococcus pentosaceus]
MASFEKRGNKYRVVVSVMDNNARRKVSKTFATKTAAKEWAIMMEADKLQNKSIIASRMTFADWFEFWMETYRKSDVRPSTYKTYVLTLNHVKKSFDEVVLEDLTYSLLQSRLDAIGKTHSKGTMSIITSRIKASLKDALYDKYILDDIFTRLKPHGIERSKKTNALSVTEFEKLQDYLYHHKLDKASLAILVALETGMRIGEVLALQYKDVSIPFNNIHISKSRSGDMNTVGKPKNKNSIRDIKITKELANIISNEKSNSTEFIFNCRRQTIRNRLDSLISKLDLQPITIHGLRHSHASYLLYKGVSINYVSARLGHANTSITQKVYAHMLKEEKTREQDKTIKVLSASPDVPKAISKC